MVIVLYICLIILLCMLFMNLFVGVIMESFAAEKDILDMNDRLKGSEKSWL